MTYWIIGINRAGFDTDACTSEFSLSDIQWPTKRTCGFPLIVDTMILRNVSSLTSSEPFCSAVRSSAVVGVSEGSSKTKVYEEASVDVIADQNEKRDEGETKGRRHCRGGRGVSYWIWKAYMQATKARSPDPELPQGAGVPQNSRCKHTLHDKDS